MSESDSLAPRSVSTAFFLALCRQAALSEAQMAEVIRLSGVPGPGLPSCMPAHLSVAQFTRLYRAMVGVCDDEMPGMFARPFRTGALRLTCLTLLEARTLHSALRRWSHLMHQLQDDVVMGVPPLDDPSGLAQIRLRPRGSQGGPGPWATDLLAKLVHGVACWLTGRVLPLRGAALRIGQRQACEALPDWYGCPVAFDQPVSALSLDLRWLQQPVVRGREDLEDFLAAAPGNWLTCAFDDPRVAVRLRLYLLRAMPDSPTSDEAAQSLHLSTRSLHRRLQDEGTSFQRVKDQLRRDLAMQRLIQGQEPIASIAFALGFDSAASFHRAFKGWTGLTPGQVRETAGAPLGDAA